MNKTWKIILVLSVAVVICLVCYFFLFSKKDNSVKKLEVIDHISEYGYELHDNSTSLYKEMFEQLKEVLNSEEVDEDKYAEYVAKLFAVDFYTLSNKITNQDIGGVDFFHPDYVDNFKDKAKDTVYKYVESNVYDNRKQQLPTVKEVNLEDITQKTFEHDKIKDSKAIIAKVSLKYEKELNYPKTLTVTLIHKDKLLCIVEVK